MCTRLSNSSNPIDRQSAECHWTVDVNPPEYPALCFPIRNTTPLFSMRMFLSESEAVVRVDETGVSRPLEEFAAEDPPIGVLMLKLFQKKFARVPGRTLFQRQPRALPDSALSDLPKCNVDPVSDNAEPVAPAATSVAGGGGGSGAGSGGPECAVEHWVLPDEIRARLERLFMTMDQDKNGVLDAEERVRMREDVRMLCIEAGMGADAFQRMPVGLSMEGFAEWFAREWEESSKMQALVGTDILRAAVRAIPGGHPEFPLRGLVGMEPSQLGKVCRTEVAAAIEAVLASKREQVIQQEQRSLRSDRGKFNHKYALGGEGVRMAKFGGIEDFHKGIAAQIGMPNVKLWEGIEAEHCRRPDSKDAFKPGNYDTTTTPSDEWIVVTDEARAAEVSVGVRRVRTLSDLMADPLVVSAGLREEEVLALVLYTGPMFIKYNTVLRGFPEEGINALKGNKYTTTIYCIVSGIIKLSKVMRLPDNRMVYRGLGGLELPEAFTTPDECGIRGGVEFAMMSTTLDRRVALQYAGQETPTIFEISLGAIDRGASLTFLSQYPAEEEILLPPRSYLEVVGGMSRREAGEDGRMIRIVSLKVNANATSSTIEQIEARRKDILVSAGENALHDIRSRLDSVVASGRVADFLVHNSFANLYMHHVKLADAIVREAEAWVERYREKEPSWFADEAQYSLSVRELSGLERMALGKFEYWLGGGSGGGNQSGGEALIAEPMEQVARKAESEMMQKLQKLLREGPESDDGNGHPAKARDLALELCKKRGVVIHGAEEKNDMGEEPIVASGARGDVHNLQLLLVAGSRIDSVSDGDGSTALHRACMMGHLEYARALVEVGADMLKRDSKGRTCLMLAIEHAHTHVVDLLLERGGKELGMMVDDGGISCAFVASSRDGGIELLKQLERVCGPELLLLVKNDGRSCAHAAAGTGHIEELKYLYAACGKDLLMVLDSNGTSCASVASYNGFLHVVKYLSETCGPDLMMLIKKDGVTCPWISSKYGQLDIVKYLFEVCGREHFMRVHNNGASCAYEAASRGHVHVVKFLFESCGRDLIFLLPKHGGSCAHVAAKEGHLEVVKYLFEVCGVELLGIRNNKWQSCLEAAQEKGHDKVSEYLARVLG